MCRNYIHLNLWPPVSLCVGQLKIIHKLYGSTREPERSAPLDIYPMNVLIPATHSSPPPACHTLTHHYRPTIQPTYPPTIANVHRIRSSRRRMREGWTALVTTPAKPQYNHHGLLDRRTTKYIYACEMDLAQFSVVHQHVGHKDGLLDISAPI